MSWTEWDRELTGDVGCAWCGELCGGNTRDGFELDKNAVEEGEHGEWVFCCPDCCKLWHELNQNDEEDADKK